MLLQPCDDAAASVLVFPAWPCSWDVSFKLAAVRNTSIEVEYAGGKLLSFVVTPAHRRTAVSFANCVKAPDESSVPPV